MDSESIAYYYKDYHFEKLYGKNASDVQRYEVVDCFNYMCDEMPYDNRVLRAFTNYFDYYVDKFINISVETNKTYDQVCVKNLLMAL
jgi:hypothetical protein